MKKVLLALLLCGATTQAQSALVSYNNLGVVYDTDLNISWAKQSNINGIMSWDTATAWAANLTLGGVTGWRLPTADPSCSAPSLCTTGELGHLAYTEIGMNAGILDTSSANYKLFSDIQSGAGYWTSTVATINTNAYYYIPTYGAQNVSFKGNDTLYAWAVHNGNVGAPASVPVPAALWLMGSSLVGLLTFTRRKLPTV